MLVEIENLKIAFQTRTSRFEAVRGVSMKLGTEKLGIVGESGSGKSLTARALMKLAFNRGFDNIRLCNFALVCHLLFPAPVPLVGEPQDCVANSFRLRKFA